jgi:hypothetical protein
VIRLWFKPSTWDPQEDILVAKSEIFAKTACAGETASVEVKRATTAFDQWCRCAERYVPFHQTAFGELGDLLVEGIRLATARDQGVPVHEMHRAINRVSYENDPLGAVIAKGSRKAARPASRGRSPARGRKVLCFACRKPGHVAWDCTDAEAKKAWEARTAPGNFRNRGGRTN